MSSSNTNTSTATSDPHARTASLRSGMAWAWRPLAAFGGPFALVLFLGLKGGGYDAVIRSEIGIGIWLLLAAAMVAGMFAIERIGRRGLAALALLTALVAWTALSMLWTESAENTFAEVGRVASYLGVLAIALALQGRHGARPTLYGVASGVAILGVLALLSRLHPAWFPPNEFAAAFPDQASRLNYPLNYPNGVASLLAIGLPLLLSMAVDARHQIVRALAAAVVPALVLAIFFTFSRSGSLVAVVAVAILLAAHPLRVRLLATSALAGGAAALLIATATARGDLTDGLATPAATSQGNEMIAIVLAVFVAVAFGQVGLDHARRRGWAPQIRLPSPPQVPRLPLAIGTVLAAIAIAAGAGAPDALSNQWQEFKEPAAAAGSTERFSNATGNGRYQYWQAALGAFRSEPVVGIGAGSYEYWWNREGTLPGAIRDGHSLYFEMLGELGPLGLLLVLALIGLVVVAAVARVRSTAEVDRGPLAAALAAAITFAVAAGLDWMWELSVVPIAFLLLAGTILASNREEPLQWESRTTQSLLARAVLVIPALLLVGVLTISALGERKVQASERALERSDPAGALEAARSAQNIQPFAATPYLQEALALQAAEDLDAAIVPARQATEKEPTNWRTWYIVWQIEEGRAEIASQVPPVREAYERAYALNPRSGSFASAAPDED